MNAEEIRELNHTMQGDPRDFQFWLRELAAQLAEQNELMRKDSELRRAVVDEERTAREKRDALLATTGEGIQAFRASLENPPQPVRMTRPGGPPEIAHLACFLCEPDGTHCFATNDGRLVRLEPEEANRILAIMAPNNPDAEAKPQ